MADILDVLVDRTDADRAYNDRHRDAVPTAEDVADWSAATGLGLEALFDQLGLALARGYDEGGLSFTVCDFIVNDLHAYLSSEDVPEPDVFWDVYLAFDAGEFHHNNNRLEDPGEVYTRPLVKALLARVEPS